MGLLPGVLTPRLQEQLTHLGAWMPFAPAAQMLTRFTGVAVSAATARRLTEVVGRAALAVEDAAVARLCDELPPVPAGPERAVLSVDGAMVPLLGGEWAEVKTLVVGEVAPEPPAATHADKPDVHLTAVSTCSRLADIEQFNTLVLGELHRRGVETAGQVAAVSDGAEWIQGFVDLHCPQAVRILDFAHAAEHVALIGQAVAPDEAGWLAPRLHRLKHEGPEPVLAELHQQVEQVAAPPPPEVSEALTYLDKRVALMQYPTWAAAGWPIGSGSVESANKLVVEARLKGAGMHWARPHVNPLLVLRNAACNDRWDETWEHSTTELRHHPLPRCPRQLAPPPPEPPRPPVPPQPPARHPWRHFTPGWLSAKL